MVIRSRHGLTWGGSCPCWANTAPEAHGERGGTHRIQDPPPTNNGIPEGLTARQDAAVQLDVSELEVDKIHPIVRDLRSHASLLPELVSLVEIGVDADIDEVVLGVRGAGPRTT